MDISQGNALCSYLYHKQAKNVISFFFSSTELENQRGEQVLPKGGGLSIPVGGRRGQGKGVGQ
jgi:hypothetical protein